MPLPVNADRSKPRKTMLVVVRCFKSDYKAKSCIHRSKETGCKDCEVGKNVSKFDVIDAETITGEWKVTAALQAMKTNKARTKPKAKRKTKGKKK